MWEGFTTGLSNLGSSISNGLGSLFGSSGAINPAMTNLPDMGTMGVNTVGLGTTQVDPNLFGGLMDFATSKQGQGLINTGISGFNALNSYNTGNKSMDLAKRQMGMQQDAYNTDKLNAEARKNLRF